jgi:hypothetical protein
MATMLKWWAVSGSKQNKPARKNGYAASITCGNWNNLPALSNPCFAPVARPPVPPVLMSSWFALQYFFAAKMRKIRNKPDGIHFLWFLPLCG